MTENRSVEVLSVAAKNTYDCIAKYLVHACPDEDERFQYRSTQYITFRKPSGGEMDAVYEINPNKVIVFNPYERNYGSALKKLDPFESQRVSDYIKERFRSCEFSHKNENYRFYILSETRKFALPHKPKPLRNNSGGWYYSLEELLSGKRIVEVYSKRK